MTAAAIAVFEHLTNVTDGHRKDGVAVAIDNSLQSDTNAMISSQIWAPTHQPGQVAYRTGIQDATVELEISLVPKNAQATQLMHISKWSSMLMLNFPYIYKKVIMQNC